MHYILSVTVLNSTVKGNPFNIIVEKIETREFSKMTEKQHKYMV